MIFRKTILNQMFNVLIWL